MVKEKFVGNIFVVKRSVMLGDKKRKTLNEYLNRYFLFYDKFLPLNVKFLKSLLFRFKILPQTESFTMQIKVHSPM